MEVPCCGGIENAVKQATLAKALAKIPNIRLVYDDFTENVNTLGRRMYVDPDKLPLVIVMVDGLCGVYASSGYNVGLADILVRIIDNKRDCRPISYWAAVCIRTLLVEVI